MTLTYILRPQFMEIYNNITQNLGFEPQNMMWGDSMPNKDEFEYIDEAFQEIKATIFKSLETQIETHHTETHVLICNFYNKFRFNAIQK